MSSVNVIYTGAVQIPICYGSLSVPLDLIHNNRGVESSASCNTLPVAERVTAPPSEPTSERYTHRRFCYIRDGGDLQMDAFYRWWWWNSNRSPLQSHQGNHLNRGPSRKRARERVMDNTDPTPVSVPNPTSPSLFYSLIDHVDFVVSRSFPHVRRSVFDPPFMIEDDAWAEHMVEIHLYFKPELAIPPTVVLHPCPLRERSEMLPSLRTMADGQAVPVTASPLMPSPTGPQGGVYPQNKNEISNRHNTEVVSVVVCERKDALRVFHPSTILVDYLKEVRRQRSSLQKELTTFLYSHYTTDPPTAIWRLCFEKYVEKYAERRLQRSLETLQGAVKDLHEEQDALVERAATTMSRIILECENIQCALSRFRNACLANDKA